MRRLMTVGLPIFLAVWLAAGVAEVLADDGTAAATIVWLIALPFAWLAMVPVAGSIGGLVCCEPRRVMNL